MGAGQKHPTGRIAGMTERGLALVLAGRAKGAPCEDDARLPADPETPVREMRETSIRDREAVEGDPGTAPESFGTAACSRAGRRTGRGSERCARRPWTSEPPNRAAERGPVLRSHLFFGERRCVTLGRLRGSPPAPRPSNPPSVHARHPRACRGLPAKVTASPSAWSEGRPTAREASSARPIAPIGGEVGECSRVPGGGKAP